MASFTVNAGVTDTTPKSVNTNDVGIIEAGGTLAAATAITWTGGSNAPGVVIDNSGTINATTRGIDSSGAFAAGGSIAVNNNAGASISATGNDAWRVNTSLNAGGTITLNNAGLVTSAGGQALDFEAVTSVNATINVDNAATGTIRSTSSDAIRPGAGNISIDNDGLIESTVARGINLNTTNLTNINAFELNNNAGGTIQGLTDAVRITAGTLSPTATGTFTIDNAGTIRSNGTGASNGQAIDFNDLVSPLGSVTITNQATGLIQAADADAVRPGTNATINNYGTIISLNGTPTSDGNDAIDFQDIHTGGIVNNFEGGTITGARHGITGDQPITVNNAGTITGQAGAGINMDTPGTTTTTVSNSGTIIGISIEGVQSGDAVDVDGLIALDNHGSIQALGVRTGGLSEGVTVGGGTINNYADGTIVSSQRAITVDGGGNLDGTANPAFAAATICNEGLIQGDNGEAIVIVGGFADSITNLGTIIGSVATDGGNDTLNFVTGSSVSGLIDGGADSDTLNLSGSGAGAVASFANIEVVSLIGGDWTLGSDGVSELSFEAGAQTLRLAAGVLADGDFDGTIDNFSAGDLIDLQGIGLATGATLDENNLLTISGGPSGPITLQLDASEDYTGLGFQLASDGNGGTTIAIVAEPGQTLNGGNGNNTLTGGAGNDIISGGNGNDVLSGGRGHDTISGGNGNDRLDGGIGNDSLSGGNGNDVLLAGAGDDSLSGGNGDDCLDGGNGNDALSGGNGNDHLAGGAGDDWLTGGNGHDTFVFASGFGHDVVADFRSGDHIAFDDGLFGDFASVLAASQQVGADTVITLDADNVIMLQHVQLASLNASDFLFV